MKNKLVQKSKRLLSGIVATAIATSMLPTLPVMAKETTDKYLYTLFAASNEKGAITVNAGNFCVNGNVATNGTIVSSGNMNINGTKTENANESMVFIFDKIDSRYFSTSEVDEFTEDYTLEEINININTPTEVMGETTLTGNININTALKSLEDVNLYGEVKNTNDSIIFSKYGDIIIDSQNVNLNGLVYAPFGDVEVTAQNLNLNNVVIIADTITLNCPNVNANYSGNAAEFVGTVSDPLDIPVDEWQYMRDKNENGIIDFFENYKNWEQMLDSDNDSIPNMIENYIEIDPYNPDTDSDKLPDAYELSKLNTNPNSNDTDGNGILDCDEDFDNDGLTNHNEYIYDTSPWVDDTDDDNLTDGEEINTYGTNPLEPDTDFDGLEDSDEIYLGTDPTLPDTDNDGILDCDERFNQTFTHIVENEDCAIEEVIVSMEGTGNLQTNTTIESVMDKDVLCSEVVGLVGEPFSIETISQFDTATLTFKIDQSKLGDTEFDNLMFLWYDEENYKFVELETFYDYENSTVSIETTHFSRYMIVDKFKWFEAWSVEFNYRPTDGGCKSNDTIITIDCSGSMYNYDTTGINSKRAQAASNFFDTMRDGDRAGVVTFTNSAEVTCNLTDSQTDLANGLDNIYSSGGTNFSAALNTALTVFDEDDTLPINKRIILLSDGQDSVPYAVLDECNERNVVVYTIGLGSSSDSILETIATYTGGEFFKAYTADELLDIYSDIGITSDFDTTDTDGDGLYDVVESAGIRLQNGKIINTDPTNSDSDDDGLSDGKEIDPKIRQFYVPGMPSDVAALQPYYFVERSDPNEPDSDFDGLLDGELLNEWGWSIKDPQPLTPNNFIPFGTSEYFDDLNENVNFSYELILEDDFYKENPINPPQIESIYTDKMMYQVNSAEYYDLIPFEYWDDFCDFFNSKVLAVNNPELHYFRNKLNRVPETLEELMNESEKWDLLKPSDAQYHMYDTSACYDENANTFKGEYNLKFVSKDGKYEAVYNYNGVLLNENNDPVNMGTYNYASPNNKLKHAYLDVMPYSDEWYLTLLFPLYGGGKGWFNVPNGYVDCAARDKNMDKYNDNEDAQERWDNYKERMQ